MKRGGFLRRLTPLRAKSAFKPTRPRPKRKINHKKALWTLFSQYIRRKYADAMGMGQCVTCGRAFPWKELQAGHYVPKKAGTSIYFDEQNVHPQCVKCNIFEAGNLTEYAIFMVKTYGPSILEDMKARKLKTLKISTAEYIDLIEKYREKLKSLEAPDRRTE